MPRALVILTHLLQELDFEEWFKLNAEWVKSQSSEAGLVLGCSDSFPPPVLICCGKVAVREGNPVSDEQDILASACQLLLIHLPFCVWPSPQPRKPCFPFPRSVKSLAANLPFNVLRRLGKLNCCPCGHLPVRMEYF